MIGNVSLNSRSVAPQTSEKSVKDGNNFNDLLKGKMELNEGKTFSEENSTVSTKGNVYKKENVSKDEVVPTVNDKLDGDSKPNENISIEEVISSLAAIIEMLKTEVSIENLPKEDASILDIQSIMVEEPEISSILNTDIKSNRIEIKDVNENLNELNSILNELNPILNSLIEMMNIGTTGEIDNKDKISGVEGLLKTLDINIQELTNNIKTQVLATDKISTNETTVSVSPEVNITENTEVNTTDINKKQVFDILEKIENGISKIAVENNTVDKIVKVQASGTDIKIDVTKVQETETLVKEVIKLLNEIERPLNNNQTKVNNTENQINELKVAQKFNLQGDTSSENSSNKDDNLEGSVAQEDKLLKSLIKDKDDMPVNRFSVINNNINTGQVQNPTEAKTINKETMTQDLIKSVKYMESNGIKELVVKVTPNELGEILIRLVQDEGVMKATIKASTKETYNLLAQNLNEIKKNLAEQNIKVQEVDISLKQDTENFNGESFSSSSFQDSRENNRFRGSNRNSSQISMDEELEIANYNDEISNLNMLV